MCHKSENVQADVHSGYDLLRVVLPSGLEVFGWQAYRSQFHAVQSRGRSDPMASLIILFKYKRQNIHLINSVVTSAAAYLNCDVILPCPGHLRGKRSALQWVFGDRLLRRIRTTAKRKFQNEIEIDSAKYAASLWCDFDELRGRSVLLVDDILTAGKTVEFYNEYFQKNGVENVRMFCLGLSSRLNPVPVKHVDFASPVSVKTYKRDISEYQAKYLSFLKMMLAKYPRCQSCGFSAQELGQVRLHVHHLLAFQSLELKEMDPLMFAAGNVLVLCNSCHALHHPGLRAYDWFSAYRKRIY